LGVTSRKLAVKMTGSGREGQRSPKRDMFAKGLIVQGDLLLQVLAPLDAEYQGPESVDDGDEVDSPHTKDRRSYDRHNPVH